jgi:hypothetical protein
VSHAGHGFEEVAIKESQWRVVAATLLPPPLPPPPQLWRQRRAQGMSQQYPRSLRYLQNSVVVENQTQPYTAAMAQLVTKTDLAGTDTAGGTLSLRKDVGKALATVVTVDNKADNVSPKQEIISLGCWGAQSEFEIAESLFLASFQQARLVHSVSDLEPMTGNDRSDKTCQSESTEFCSFCFAENGSTAPSCRVGGEYGGIPKLTKVVIFLSPACGRSQIVVSGRMSAVYGG